VARAGLALIDNINMDFELLLSQRTFHVTEILSRGRHVSGATAKDHDGRIGPGIDACQDGGSAGAAASAGR